MTGVIGLVLFALGTYVGWAIRKVHCTELTHRLVAALCNAGSRDKWCTFKFREDHMSVTLGRVDSFFVDRVIVTDDFEQLIEELMS